MEQNSDSSIIQRARQGDQDAVSRLYNETKNYAYFVARRYLRNDEDIADVLQEAYISVFSKLDTFEDGRPFKPWLHTIVTNKCLNFIKSKRAVFVSQDEIGELASDDEEIIPAAWLERAEKRRDIIRIIDGLPEGQRMAVTLFYFEGLSISEMAEIMGVAEGTIKAHLYYGRKNIKEEVLREEKKGNKLYAIVPLPLLTQLFELEAETAVMPESMSQKVWEGTLQQLVSNGVVAGSASAASSVVTAGSAKTGMALATKIIIGVVAAAVVTAGAIFLPPLLNPSDEPTPPGVTNTETPIDTSKGTYEGEYDANGKRSGYGVWVYDNFRYEGYWENDMPNGEGTLYETSIPPAEKDTSRTYTSKITVHGNWVDGFSDGMITLSWLMENGATNTWTLETTNGYPTQDGTVYTADGLTNLSYSKTQLFGGVPPWADVQTHPSDAPSGNDTTATDPTPDKTYDKPVVLLPDPETISEEYLAKINSIFTMGASSEAEVAAVVDNILDETYEKYGKYLNENISKLCVKVALYSSEAPIAPEALKKVNDLLEANGEEPLDANEPEQRIGALWIAASLYFDPDYGIGNPYLFGVEQGWRYDIAMAFALVKYPEPGDTRDTLRDSYASIYAHLFNLWPE